MEKNTQFVGHAAELNRPVLVIGERGTGKELIAERLHHLSPRWGEPLIVMNCAALPETLIEAELFGHEQGAFTGANRARPGRFEEADGGTLFLDELGTLSMAAQERLLRVIEYGEVTRIGASKPLRVDVRIVAATNDDLPAAADAGRFRPDLLDRLSFEVITLPPLRAREGDIPVLADHFGRRMAAELNWPQWPGFSPVCAAQLEAYGWPGNVRELRNVVERAVYRWDEPGKPIDRLTFDPFASPWKPKPLMPGASAPSGDSTPAPAPAPAIETRARNDVRDRTYRNHQRPESCRRRARSRHHPRRARPPPLQPARHCQGAGPDLRPATPLHEKTWTGRGITSPPPPPSSSQRKLESIRR